MTSRSVLLRLATPSGPSLSRRRLACLPQGSSVRAAAWICAAGLLSGCGWFKDDDKDDAVPPPPAPVATASGFVIVVPEGIAFSSPSQAIAAGEAKNPERWALVRRAATWTRQAALAVEKVLVPAVQSGALARAETYTAQSQVLGDQTYTIRLTVGADESLTSTAYQGTKQFSHRFEAWRAADKAKALELFFDDPKAAQNDGALAFFSPKALGAKDYAGDAIVVESYLSGAAPARRQTLTWTGGALVAGGFDDRGRVILEDVDLGAALAFKSVQRFLKADLCPGVGDDYATLAFIQTFARKNEATATFGLANDGLPNGSQACGLNNEHAFGLFDTSGFLKDGQAAPSETYPRADRVRQLITSLSMTPQSPGDDARKATLDAFDIKFKQSGVP